MKYIKHLTFKQKVCIRKRGAKEFYHPLSSLVWLEMFGYGRYGKSNIKSRFYGRLNNIRTYYTPRRKSTREFFAY